MILLDTSALAKLLVEGHESAALRSEISAQSATGEEFAISTVAITELRRLAIRLAAEPTRVELVTAPFRVFRLTEGVLQLAGRIPYRHLGTLDAIHVATALVAEVQGMITYDARQAEAAAAEGLAIAQPGR